MAGLIKHLLFLKIVAIHFWRSLPSVYALARSRYIQWPWAVNCSLIDFDEQRLQIQRLIYSKAQSTVSYSNLMPSMPYSLWIQT